MILRDNAGVDFVIWKTSHNPFFNVHLMFIQGRFCMRIYQEMTQEI
jgi:hypothetical protein